MKKTILILALAACAGYPLQAIGGGGASSSAFVSFYTACKDKNLPRMLGVTETSEMVVVRYALPKLRTKMCAEVLGVQFGCTWIGLNPQNPDGSKVPEGLGFGVPEIPCSMPFEQVLFAFPEPGILQMMFPKIQASVEEVLESSLSKAIPESPLS